HPDLPHFPTRRSSDLTCATTNRQVASSASAMSWASVPALLNAQAVKPGRNNRPAAARNALRRDKSAVFIAVASQVNQPEIMITAGAGDNAAVAHPRSGRPADRGAVLADNAIVGDAARRRVLLCLNQPVLGLG